MKQQIFPCLWFDNNAKEAAEFYCSVFKNSVIISDNSMVTVFESSGEKFMCLNGGPFFKFNPSISFYVACTSIEETNRTWEMLINGGSELMPYDEYPWSKKYGWLQDKYGLNWQISYEPSDRISQKITPVLMFTDKQKALAKEAIQLYTSLFEGSGLTGILEYSEEEQELKDSVKHAQFKLGEKLFMAMDSSKMHEFTFNEAVSFVVTCENQDEIDFYWNKFTSEGEESQCGWLKDKFGISWQIVPSVLSELMNDPSRSDRVIAAFMQMKKFDIQKLLDA